MAENRIEEPPAPPSLLDDLLRKTHEFVEGAIVDRVKTSVDRALEWTFRRIIVYVSAAALFATGAVFLLIAGMEGLRQIGAPAWAAYLVLGLTGGLGGAALLQRPREKPTR